MPVRESGKTVRWDAAAVIVVGIIALLAAIERRERRRSEIAILRAETAYRAAQEQRREPAGAVAEAGRWPVAGPFFRLQPSPAEGSRRATGRAPPGEPGRLRGAMTATRGLDSMLASISLLRRRARFGPSCRNLTMSGSCGESSAIWTKRDRRQPSDSARPAKSNSGTPDGRANEG